MAGTVLLPAPSSPHPNVPCSSRQGDVLGLSQLQGFIPARAGRELLAWALCQVLGLVLLLLSPSLPAGKWLQGEHVAGRVSRSAWRSGVGAVASPMAGRAGGDPGELRAGRQAGTELGGGQERAQPPRASLPGHTTGTCPRHQGAKHLNLPCQALQRCPPLFTTAF